MMRIICLVLTYLWLQCEARRLERCELANILRNLDFPEDKLSDWVCLVEHTSNRYTKVLTTNEDGSRNYGIFQINDKYWCSNTDEPGKDCDVTCAELMDDDITEAAICALKIYRSRHQKFKAWYGWTTYCQKPGSLPDVTRCYRHDSFRQLPFFFG